MESVTIDDIWVCKRHTQYYRHAIAALSARKSPIRLLSGHIDVVLKLNEPRTFVQVLGFLFATTNTSSTCMSNKYQNKFKICSTFTSHGPPRHGEGGRGGLLM